MTGVPPRRGASAGDETAAGPRPQRRRLDRDERERMIVEEAIRFFAEVGFEGQTRELAKRVGVTQPLLYRYFPSKDDLIERVYLEVFVRRWNPRWETLIADDSLSVRQRLVRFYKEYTAAIFHYEWVRIFMFAGLKGVNINRRYLGILRERLFIPVCAAVRREAGLPSPDEVAITEEEIESAWALHGGFYYIAIRKWVYGLDIPDDLDSVIEHQVGVFLDGAAATVRTALDASGESR